MFDFLDYFQWSPYDILLNVPQLNVCMLNMSLFQPHVPFFYIIYLCIYIYLFIYLFISPMILVGMSAGMRDPW